MASNIIGVKVSTNEGFAEGGELIIKRIHVMSCQSCRYKRGDYKQENTSGDFRRRAETLYQTILNLLKPHIMEKSGNFPVSDVSKRYSDFSFAYPLNPSTDVERLLPSVRSAVEAFGMKCLTEKELSEFYESETKYMKEVDEEEEKQYEKEGEESDSSDEDGILRANRYS